MQDSRGDMLNRELERFVQIVSTQMRPDRIVLFGSLAAGSVHEWSDLDIAVIMETDLPYLERLKRIVQQVQPTVTTDPFVYTPAEWAEMKRTRPFVRDEIDAKGKVVYERLLKGIRASAW